MNSDELDVTTSDRQEGQFGLASIFTLIGFSAFLLAVVSQRSALGVLAWSVIGIAYSCFMRMRYLRRSLLCLFAGTGSIAAGFLHPFTASLDEDLLSILFLLPIGVIFALAGGLATAVNVFSRQTPF